MMHGNALCELFVAGSGKPIFTFFQGNIDPKITLFQRYGVKMGHFC